MHAADFMCMTVPDSCAGHRAARASLLAPQERAWLPTECGPEQAGRDCRRLDGHDTCWRPPQFCLKLQLHARSPREYPLLPGPKAAQCTVASSKTPGACCRHDWAWGPAVPHCEVPWQTCWRHGWVAPLQLRGVCEPRATAQQLGKLCLVAGGHSRDLNLVALSAGQQLGFQESARAAADHCGCGRTACAGLRHACAHAIECHAGGDPYNAASPNFFGVPAEIPCFETKRSIIAGPTTFNCLS